MVEDVGRNVTYLGLNDTFQNASIRTNITILDLLARRNMPVIAVYSSLFCVAAIGNLTVFISLFRSRYRKSRISLMIRHLTIADLIVTFVMIPIEVCWRLTVRWIAGNVACKVFLFLRAFGPYLSSNVLVCVSLDRYFAVLHPLKVNDARRRGRVMLAVAWGTAFVCCIPQSDGPSKKPQYTQCVASGLFTSSAQEVAYNVLCVMFMYFIPLFVIIVAYTAIMCEISKNTKGTHGETYRASNGRLRLRRSDISNIERARSRTLRMTITIVAVYVWCCTPYVIMTLWYMFNRESAKSLPEWLQEGLFMMVVSNSCVNPIVYGSYVVNCRRNCCGCFGRSSGGNHLKNDGDMQMAAGQRGQIARRVIKCFLGLKKVGSGATRSTGMGNVIKRSPMEKTSNKVTGISIKRGSSSKGLPESMSRVSYKESTVSRYCRASFHSELMTSKFPLLEEQTLGILSPGNAYSEPNMSNRSNIGMNISDEQVYYNNNSDYSEKSKARNI